MARLALALLLVLASPALAEGRRAVVVLAPAAPAESLLQALAEPRWAALLDGAALALVNASVPGPDTPEKARLALLRGRRTGLDRETGIPFLPSLDGVCRLAGLRVAVLPPTRPGELAAERLRAALDSPEGPDLLLAELPADASVNETLDVAAQLARTLHPGRDLLVVAAASPGPARSGEWVGLCWALLVGGGLGESRLVSATTRTPGLIANVDLAPTVLQHLGVAPPPWMEGHPARALPADFPDELGDLLRFARHVRATKEVGQPCLFAWGAVALAATLAALLALRRSSKPGAAARARGVLALPTVVPTALLLAGAVPAPSATVLGMRIAGLTLLLALLARLPAGGRVPAASAAAALVVTLLADLLTGGRLLSRCLLGDFANTGVRFYGIGNEFAGLLLGAAVALPFWLEATLHPAGRPCGLPTGAPVLSPALQRSAWALWALATLVVASPAHGADFGGGIAFGAAGLVAAALAAGRGSARRIVLLALLGGGIVAAAAIAWDLARPPEARSHLGELAARTLSGQAREVVVVALRKLRMNVDMALTPYFLGALALVALLAAFCYHKLGAGWLAAVLKRDAVRAAAIAVTVGGSIALVVNDSGVVTWALASGWALVMLLDVALLDRAGAASG